MSKVLEDLLVNVRASADQFSADMRKVQASSQSTTNAIVASWGKSGDAATTAVQRMEQRAASREILRNFDTTTGGIVKGWGKTADSANEAAAKTQRSFDSAGSALKSLEQMIGVNLPNAAGKFLEKSTTIGPILTGAFSAIAVVGLISALSELPAVFNKLIGAITGWDDAAKKAYTNFLELNAKAIQAAEEFRLKVIEIGTDKATALTQAIKDQATENQRNLGIVTTLNEKLNEQRRIAEELVRQGITGGIPMLSPEDQARLVAAEQRAKEGGTKLLELQRQLTLEKLGGQKKAADDLADKQKKAAEDSKRLQQQEIQRVQAIIRAAGNDMFRYADQIQAQMTASIDAITDRFVRAQDTIERITAANRVEMGKHAEGIAQDASKWLDVQSDTYVKSLDKRSKDAAEQLQRIDELNQEAGDRLIRDYENAFTSVKHTATRAFLDIFAEGEFQFTRLSGVIKGIFRTLASELLGTLTASLITPLVQRLSGGLSGLLGKIPGLGGAGGLGGLLSLGGTAAGSLFGAGGTSLAAIQAGAVPLLPLGAIGGATAGGIGGAGTAAGAGAAAGISAATIAATAGISAAVLGAIAWAKSQAHHEASTFVRQFQDPFSNAAVTGAFDKMVTGFNAAVAAGQLTVEEAQKARTEAENFWKQWGDTAQEYAQRGSDERLVVRQAFDTLTPLMNQVFADMDTAIRGIAEQTEAMAHDPMADAFASFRALLKPADELNIELERLAKAFNLSDIVEVYAEQILAAAEAQRDHGYELTGMVASLEEAARAEQGRAAQLRRSTATWSLPETGRVIAATQSAAQMQTPPPYQPIINVEIPQNADKDEVLAIITTALETGQAGFLEKWAAMLFRVQKGIVSYAVPAG